MLLAAGTDPFALVEEAVAAAAAISGDARPLRDKRLPPNLDVFGFCSWDAFYSAVSASGACLVAPTMLYVVLSSVIKWLSWVQWWWWGVWLAGLA